MSKTIQYLDLPKIISTSDITPWLEVLESIGFKAVPNTGVKLEYKNSGLALYSTSNSIRITSLANSYNIGSTIINSLNTTESYRFAYIKFGNSGIAFTIVKATDRAKSLKVAITECGNNNWFCYSTNYMWKTGTGTAEESILTNGNFKTTPDSMLLVPIKYYGDIIPDLYIAIYGPSSSDDLFVCHVGTKAYLASHNYAPFAIDVDAIWDDEDY